jgi:tetratricopeptide (TPR) repeat protein
MIEEGGYRALERGDLISAYNEFSLAESGAGGPLERSRIMINKGALLLAMGRYSPALRELLGAKSLLKSANDPQLLAVACLDIAKALIAIGRAEDAESELRCAEGIACRDDPHVVYVKALIYFYRGQADELERIDERALRGPYDRLIRVLKLRMKADRGESVKDYEEALREAVPPAALREALGLV